MCTTPRALCAVVAECCLLLWKSPPTGKTTTPHKPPAQPWPSPQLRLHHACCMLKRLHLTLQCPMACPGLATHKLAGLCELWLPSAASSSGNLHTPPSKPHPPQTTCPALPQPPGQAPPHLMHTAEAASDLAVPHGMLRAGHSHTGRALCNVGVEQCLHNWKTT